MKNLKLYQKTWLDDQLYAVLSPYNEIHKRSDLLLALRKWQLGNLYKTLVYVQKNSLVYQQKFKDCNFSSKMDFSMLGVEDIEKQIHNLLKNISPSSPQAIAKNPEAFLAVSHDEVTGIITSSGTTAESKRIFYSDVDMDKTIEFFRYGMSFLVQKQNKDKVALLMSGDRVGSVGYLLQEAMRKNGIACYVLGFPQDEDEIMSKLIDLEITCIVALPCHVLALSKHQRAKELSKKLQNILVSGDAITSFMRQTIASAWGCELFVHYGLTEIVLAGAVECTKRQACHIRELDLIIEIVDPQFQVLADGLWGELVITTLAHQAKEAMPLIRYQTGDYARIVEGDCACGSILKRLEVLGRIDNAIFIDEKTSIHITQLDNIIFAFSWIKAYNAFYYIKSLILVLELDFLNYAPQNACNILQEALKQNLQSISQIKKIELVPCIISSQAKKVIQKIDK